MRDVNCYAAEPEKLDLASTVKDFLTLVSCIVGARAKTSAR